MTSEFSYKLTTKAEADLDEIVSYIAIQLENPQAATGILNKLQDAIHEACSFPESGSQVVNEFFPYKGIRKKLVGNYIMYYFPDMNAETVYILRVIYGRRNLDEILREMSFS
jgi:toxin ParE1/3/4